MYRPGITSSPFPSVSHQAASLPISASLAYGFSSCPFFISRIKLSFIVNFRSRTASVSPPPRSHRGPLSARNSLSPPSATRESASDRRLSQSPPPPFLVQICELRIRRSPSPPEPRQSSPRRSPILDLPFARPSSSAPSETPRPNHPTPQNRQELLFYLPTSDDELVLGDVFLLYSFIMLLTKTDDFLLAKKYFRFQF